MHSQEDFRFDRIVYQEPLLAPSCFNGNYTQYDIFSDRLEYFRFPSTPGTFDSQESGRTTMSEEQKADLLALAEMAKNTGPHFEGAGFNTGLSQTCFARLFIDGLLVAEFPSGPSIGSWVRVPAKIRDLIGKIRSIKNGD